MKINSGITFTDDLKNKNSQTFRTTKRKVEDQLKPKILSNVPGSTDVQVYGFEKGSVIAKFNIIMDAASTTNTSQAQAGVDKTIQNGTFTGYTVNTTYTSTVEGENMATLVPNVFIKWP